MSRLTICGQWLYARMFSHSSKKQRIGLTVVVRHLRELCKSQYPAILYIKMKRTVH